MKKPETWYSHWRIDFFRSHPFVDGTVRLAGDVEQMKLAFGKNFVYHADMLFRTPDYFEPKMLPPTDKIRVCLQFKKVDTWISNCWQTFMNMQKSMMIWNFISLPHICLR